MNIYIRKAVALLFLLPLFISVQGQTANQPVEVTKRKALVGPNCILNQLATGVKAATGYSHLEYITDTDLNNYASITGVQVAAALAPVLSVKDLKHSYKAGTTAGFSLVSTEGGGLLSLSVIKLFAIATYLNGQHQETIAVKQADSGGVGLNLIKIPGSDAVTVDVNVTTTKDFDEIYLMQGGVDVQLIEQLSIKYAFVGDPKEVLLTYKGLQDYSTEIGETVKIDYDRCDGMPWPVKDRPVREDTFHDVLFDEDLTDFLGTGFISIAELFHVQIGFNRPFEAGTEVGFKYFKKGAVDLVLGGSMEIVLYDEKNKVVQRELVSGGVLNLGVIETGEKILSITSKVPFYAARLTAKDVLGVHLSGSGVYYGFVREKPEVDHHCLLNPSMSATICDNETTYLLKSNPDVPVDWKVTSFSFPNPSDPRPENEVINAIHIGLTENGVAEVTGLTENGVYTFVATSVGCPSEPQCSEEITLTKGVQANPELIDCGKPVVNEEDADPLYELSTDWYGVTGSLISISSLKNRENIIDSDLSNYATYVSGLSLIDNMGLVGIKTVDQSLIGQEVVGDKRVGFIVENASTFLDADALKFLRIKLFRRGVEVRELTIDESNAVGAGLIGKEQSQKIRYSVKVPELVEFDEFQLWTAGVLNLGLNTLRIYCGFVESADDNCSDPLNCAQIVSVNSQKASFEMKLPFELVSAVAALEHAEYLIDDDMNTALSYGHLAGVGGGIVLCVKLGRTLDASQQLGVVIDSKTHLANLDLGGWMTVETYNQGVATGDSFSNWGVLGLNLIGFGDKSYLISHPQQPYDEVRIVMAGIANVAEGMKFYGLFFRSDIDGDGLPDCMDPECCQKGLSHLEATPHICVNDEVILTGQGDFKEETKDYQVEITSDPNDPTVNPVFTGKFTFYRGVFQRIITQMKEAGKYHMVLKELPITDETTPIAILPFTVHPLETTWLKNVNSTDWNEWENWNAGSPWTCTNVIIPTGALAYPILQHKVMNGCNYIHFEPNAEVVNTHRLTYQKAWVETRLKPNRYYMLSAPLKQLYSGDWFIPSAVTDVPYFTVLNEQTMPENRVTPTIYQRVWDAMTIDKLISVNNRPYPKPSEPVDVTKTGWTKPYNWLAVPYEKIEVDGFAYDFNALSLWIHPSKPSDPEGEGSAAESYLFRFPKAHSVYHYYDADGTQLTVAEQIRNRNRSGRFIYEQTDGSVTFPVVMSYKNRSSSMNTTFLVGNPFMSHINVKEFLKENSHLTSVKVYDGENGTANSQIANLDGEGMLTATVEDATGQFTSIAPMQSFFVTCEGEFAESCDVSFTEQMLESKPTGHLLRMEKEQPEKHSIRLVAEAKGKRAGALIHFSAQAHDTYREKEDADLLLENETKPTVAIFSVAEQRALDIQQRLHGGEIPLGICLAQPTDVTLKVTVPDEYPNWVLKDQLTGTSYALVAGQENRIALGRLTSNVGRFSLSGCSVVTANEQISATQPKVCCFREEESHQLIVSSDAGMMVRCEVFSLSGQLVGLSEWETNVYRLPIPEGIYIVKVYFGDGITASIKVF